MLLLDIGNSAVKSALVANKKIKTIERFIINAQDTLSIVKNIIRQNPNLKKILVSNSNQQLDITKLKTLHKNLQVVHSEKSFKQLKNAYSNYQQLGSDRWLNMIYAWEKINNACCVIDCGTCITYDQIDKTGQHLGGFILPGKKLAQNTLIDLLAVKTDLEPSMQLGKSTKDCIINGSELSFISNIRGLIQYFQSSTKRKHHSNILITGADVTLLKQVIKDDVIFIDNMTIQALLLLANLEQKSN